ncbi:MAG: primosomal protein N' [Vigna little leaf phytoplasma]|nr:primosomal protein N' [Vigna little leaf phytoplasma]
MFAEIIVDIRVSFTNQCFDYIIPSNLISQIQKGQRVIVPFGAQDNDYLGYILDIKYQSTFATKKIKKILDKIPFIKEEFFLIAEKMLETPFVPKTIVFKALIPPLFSFIYEKKVTIIREKLVPREIKNILEQKKYRLTPKDPILNTIIFRKLIQNKNLKINNVIKEKIKKKNIQPLKKEIVTQLQNINDILLTPQQIKIWNQINLVNYQTYLLTYVEYKDKINIYLKLILEIIKKQKQILILVPEIILIKTLNLLIQKHFPMLNIVLWHSKLNTKEYLQKINNIQNNPLTIIIGTRSAIFARFKKLGIIILDEEDDELLIEKEKIPYYDARDLAKIRANYHNIPLILTSSSPSLKSIYQVKKKNYQFLSFDLNKKKNNLQLIDMKEELKKGNLEPFSEILYQKIKEKIQKKEKTLLFINSRGFAPFMMCRLCSYTPKCSRCEQNMTLFLEKKILKCRFCNNQENFLLPCPNCHLSILKTVSFGIQYIENFLKKKFPLINILRIDSDSLYSEKKHEQILANLNKNNIDILLGTKMIVKNIQIPSIKLVGVIMADLLLNMPTYEAAEKTFQLLTKISKYSSLDNSVLVQSYNIQHYALQTAIENNLSHFYKQELKERKLSQNPPFWFVSQILISHANFYQASLIAMDIKENLQNNLQYQIKVFGPITPHIKKKNNLYRLLLVLKYKSWPLNIKFIMRKNLNQGALILFDLFANIK